VKLSELYSNNFEWKNVTFSGVKTYSDPSCIFSGGVRTTATPGSTPCYQERHVLPGICLSVCLSLSRITKLLLTNFDYFFRLGCGVWLVRRPDWILVLIRLIRHTQSRQWVIGSDPWPTDPPKNWPMTNYAWPVTNRFNNHEMHKIMGHGSTCTDPWPIWPSQKSDPFDPLIHDLSTHCLLWTHDVG